MIATDKSNYIVSYRIRGHKNLYLLCTDASSEKEAVDNVKRSIVIETVTKSQE